MPVWGELIVSGDRALGVHSLQNESVIIGRSSKADIKIVHTQISAQHCQLIFNKSTHRVVVIDKSSNGTLLRSNGVTKKMGKGVENELHECDRIILVKTAEKNDEVWFEFHRLISPPPSGLENVVPNVTPAKPPTLSFLGQGDVIETNSHSRGERIVTEEPRQSLILPSVSSIDQPIVQPPQPSIPQLAPSFDQPDSPIALSKSKTHCPKLEDSLNDSCDADLPDFDDVLKPYAPYVPAVPPADKKIEPTPPVTVKILQFPVKRAAPEKNSPTSGPSAAKKSVAVPLNTGGPFVSTSTTTTTSTPFILTRVTAPVTTSGAANFLDDSDDLPDLIPHFKAPASVAELRAKPAPTIASTATVSSKTASAAQPVVSAAERARKLMAASLPADFLTDKTSSSTIGESESAQSEHTSASTESTAKPSSGESMGESLICSICQEIFHEPCNVTPCNHVFCAGCLSMWLAKSKDCPQCRTHVSSCAEHHLLKSLVEAFLSDHPDRKRTAEEIAELDKHNTITRNKKMPETGRGRGGAQAAANSGGVPGYHGDYEGDSDSDSYDGIHYDNSDFYDDSDSDDSGNNIFPFGGDILGFLAGLGGRGARGGARGARGGRGRGSRGAAHVGTLTANQVPQVAWGLLCKQCPGGALASAAPATPANRGGRGGRRGRTSTAAAAASSSLAGPSTSFAVPSANGTIPAPASIPPYTCTSAAHNTCRCCTERFPSREGHPGIPPMRCALCMGTYCHLYWGCRAPGCIGCLGTLAAFTTTAHELEGGIAVQTNTVEAGFFADYLHSHSVSPQSVLTIGYQMLELNALPELNGTTPQSVICRLCFKNKVIPAIAYAYRAQLTNADLPAAIANRPNCAWGKDCRTQKKSVPHSRKHNHICQPGNNSATSSH